MFKTKNFKNHKKQAQHVVELALIMPVFLIIFSYTFQIMVETFSQCRFAYTFTNSIKGALNSQPVFNQMSDYSTYISSHKLKTDVQDIITNVMGMGENSVFKSTNISAIESDIMSFFVGVFEYSSKTIFFKESAARNYFFFIIPINSAYLEPMVLNYPQTDVTSFFDNYYLTVNSTTEVTSSPARATATDVEANDDGTIPAGEIVIDMSGEGESVTQTETTETVTPSRASLRAPMRVMNVPERQETTFEMTNDSGFTTE